MRVSDNAGLAMYCWRRESGSTAGRLVARMNHLRTAESTVLRILMSNAPAIG